MISHWANPRACGGAGTKPRRQLGSSHSFVPPPPHEPQPPASICCPRCKAPLPPASTPMLRSWILTTRRDTPPGILLSQDTEERPRQCPPPHSATPARKDSPRSSRQGPCQPTPPPSAGVAWLKALGASQAAAEGKHETLRPNDLSRLRRLRNVFPAASLS